MSETRLVHEPVVGKPSSPRPSPPTEIAPRPCIRMGGARTAQRTIPTQDGAWARLMVCCLALFFLTIASGAAAEREFLHPGHVPAAVARLQPVDRLPGAMQLDLAIGLPLRNRKALTNLLQQIYDPASPSYHHYLTPEQFTEMFGPTEQEYQRVTDYLKSHGFQVTGTHPNRVVLDVTGTVADIEKTFQLT
ncbi:MAG TPA: protease pro-enzyme activation domain-containing protein, partial [Verrucomicrobiae bacterium]|nr:protease pro-enzyme activation domain-containing protein [Verrucomicrobiae bacterium]